MSKALLAVLGGCIAGETPATTAPSDGWGGVLSVTVLAVGLWTLAAWAVLRLMRPRKLLLVHAPGRPNNASLPLVVGVYLAYQTIAGLLAWGLAYQAGVPARDIPIQLSLPATIGGQFVAIALSLTLAAYTFHHGINRGLGLTLRHPINDLARGVVGCLAVIPVMVGLLKLLEWLIEKGWLPIKPQLHPVLEFLPQAGAVWIVVATVSAVVLAPLAEEIFFRGLLQSSLKRYFRNPWPAVLITSLVFALVHWQHEAQATPSLLVLGVVLGYNYERTARLGGPILIHSLFNAFVMTNTLLQGR